MNGPSDEMWTYSPASGFRQLNPTNPPSVRLYATTWVDENGNFWLYGGLSLSSGSMSDLWEYNASSNAWNQITSNTPAARIQSCSWTSLDDELWLFGGLTSTNTYSSDLWSYNISANQWVFRGDMSELGGPSGREAAECWNYNNQFVVYSGYDGEFDDMWVYTNPCPADHYGFLCNTYCNASDTCNNNGICNATGECQCATGFQGPNCNTCANNYYSFPTCSFCSADETCNNHGSCNPSGQCQCSVGFAGPNCDSCAPGYSNYPACTVACSRNTTCSGHGACSGAGQCQCDTGFEGPNCNTCAPGYSSYPLCTPQVVGCPSANFCPSFLSCCNDIRGGPSCYDPVAYSCLISEFKQVLCLNSDGVCGSICYDKLNYLCCQGNIYDIHNPMSNPCLSDELGAKFKTEMN